MTSTENAQYLTNYLDLRQGLPSWIGHKQANGVTPQNLAQAAQCHWTIYGVSEHRIFLPMQPPSTVPYIPPPATQAAAKSSSSGSWIGPAISAVATIAVAVLGPNDMPAETLNDAEINLIVTSAAITKKILPFYLQVAPDLVHSINNRLDSLLSQYAI